MDDLSPAFAGATRVDTPRMRLAGRELLSLGLIEARNRTLGMLNGFEAALEHRLPALLPLDGFDPPLWLFGHVGWFQEAWIARNLMRAEGRQADRTRPRLASIDAHADACFDPLATPAAGRWHLDLPDASMVRQYLGDTLEVTLELLADSAQHDEALHVYRLALFHEDLCTEILTRCAQRLQIDPGVPFDPPVARSSRPPLSLPATRWLLGSPPGGFVPDAETWAHEVSVPAFDIDAQPVTWAQFVEFVDDGGYDEPRWWSSEGLAWLEASGTNGRRAPAHVQQLRGGVVQQRFGRDRRVSMFEAVDHVSWHEAQAWCRWAGRRLPTEVEWEVAAHVGARQGLAWGGVLEWTASRFEPYPGFEPDLWEPYTQSCFHTHRAVRGASWATPGRLRHPKARQACHPDRDDAMTGFRSCAL